MPYACLLLSGAALLVNGLATLGHLPRRDAAVLSLVVGSVQLALGAVVLSLNGAAGTAPTAAGILLFGLTYAYSGLDTLLNLGAKGLGWFCGMVAFVAVLLAFFWLAADPLLAVLWLAWAVLWGLMFASLALGMGQLDRFTGWSLVLASQVSATVPAVLGLAGLWPRGPGAAWLAAVILAVLFVAALMLARRGPAAPQQAGHRGHVTWDTSIATVPPEVPADVGRGRGHAGIRQGGRNAAEAGAGRTFP